MNKNQWSRWLRSYYGVRMTPAQLKMIERFVETDGGRSTWDTDPAPARAVLVVRGSSRSFWAILKPGNSEIDFEA